MPYAAVGPIHWVDATAALVRARLAATMADAVERDPRTRDPTVQLPATSRATRHAERQDELAAARIDTQHTLAAHADRDLEQVDEPLEQELRCPTCGTAATVGNELLWLRSPCVARAPLPFCPEAAAVPTQITIGNQTIHHSHHAVYVKRLSVWSCTACGMHATSLLRGLAAECIVALGLPRTRGGDLALACIRRGFRPGTSADARAFNQQLAGHRTRAPPRRTRIVRHASIGKTRASARLALSATRLSSAPAASPEDTEDQEDAESLADTAQQETGEETVVPETADSPGVYGPFQHAADEGDGTPPSAERSLHQIRLERYLSAASSSSALPPQTPPVADEEERGFIASDAENVPVGGALPCAKGPLAHHHAIDTDSDSSDSIFAFQRGDSRAARAERANRASSSGLPAAPLAAPAQDERVSQEVDASGWEVGHMTDLLNLHDEGILQAWPEGVTADLVRHWLAARGMPRWTGSPYTM